MKKSLTLSLAELTQIIRERIPSLPDGVALEFHGEEAGESGTVTVTDVSLTVEIPLPESIGR